MGIDLSLGEKMLIGTDTNADYDTSKHHGLRINFMQDAKTKKAKATIFIFGTGSIVMTGCKDMEHMMAAYEFVTNFLESNYDELYVNVVPRRIPQARSAKRIQGKAVHVVDADMIL